MEFGFGVVMARLLVPADFGLLVTVQIYTGIAGFIAGGGMAQALIQSKSITDEDFKTGFSLQLASCGLIYLVFFLLAPWFAVWYSEPIYTDLVRVSALNFLFRPFVSIPKVRLQRSMRFGETAVIDAIGVMVAGAVSIAMARHGFGVWSLVAGGLSTSLFSIVPLYWLTRWCPGIRIDPEGIRKLGGYGVKESFNNILEHVRSQLANFVIGQRLGPSTLGIWNKADSLHVIPSQLVGGSLYQPLFRGLAAVQGDADKARYLYLKAITVSSIYTFPFYVGLYWLAGQFVTLVYGPAWAAVAEPLRIFSLAGFLMTIGLQSRAVLASQNRLGRIMTGQVETIILLAITVVMFMDCGLEYLAWGYLGVSSYQTLRFTTAAMKIVRCGVSELLAALLPALVLNLFMGFCLWSVDRAIREFAMVGSDLYYFLAMAGSGGFSYVLGFFAIPFEATKPEVTRWRNLLRL